MTITSRLVLAALAFGFAGTAAPAMAEAVVTTKRVVVVHHPVRRVYHPVHHVVVVKKVVTPGVVVRP